MFNSEVLEEKLGYTFKDKSLLKAAFTHSTYVNVHGGKSNERLEYLGDAVLQLIFTEEQYLQGTDAEGEMTEGRQKVVSKEPLREAIETLGVAKYMLVEGGKENVEGKTISNLYECILAAVYLDGGYEEARAFFKRHRPPKSKQENYIGKLQEFLKDQPVYSSSQTGPDHKPVFYARVEAYGITGEGTGGSKKSAKQAAAKALLDKLKGAEKEKSEKRRK